MLTFTWVLAAFAVFSAATLQSLTGFGFAMIAVPLLMLVYEPKMAVGTSSIIACFSALLLAISVRKAVIKPILKNIILGAVLGIPLGIYILFHSNTQTLKIFISGITFAISLLMLSGYKWQGKSGIFVERIVGIISGFLAGSVGMPGPPVVLYLNDQGIPKENFRATSAAYLLSVYPISITLLVFFGVINLHIALNALALVPFALLGGFFGRHIFNYVPQKVFSQGVPILILISSVYSVITNI